MYLVHQFSIIIRNHERIHGSKNNRDSRAQRMNSTLAKIKKSGKAVWSDIRGSSALLHLLVAALHGVSSCLRYIIEPIHIIKASAICLTVGKQDTHPLSMVGANGILEHLTTQI